MGQEKTIFKTPGLKLRITYIVTSCFCRAYRESAENIQRMLAKLPVVNAAARKAAKDLATHVRVRS